MDMLALLAEVLEEEEEWILFGSRKGSEQQERLYLSRISEEEGRLLTAFREASREAQKAILETSKSIAKASPAPHAVVHHLKRKDDRA